MRTDLPSGTVTFLFTDIEGSTRLLHRLGPDAYAAALAEHRRALRSAFAGHGGVEVDTQGDAFFVAFPTAEGAAAAAQAGVDALRAGPIRVRIGLHTGTPTVTAEGYVGADVHLGARVAALASGGQVLATEATRALLPAATDVRDLGLHRLKDVPEPTRLLQVGDAEFPPLRTPGAIDLPSPASRFVGRQRELYDAVATWFEREPRVLTIVGPGGTGKTRFAIELARLLAEEADGGTVFAGLAPLRDPELAVQSIAERLGAASAEPAAVAARVGGRRAHVLVDNVEQLLPAVARRLAELAAAAPELRLIVTSREPLRIGGETELDLPPLDEQDGVALFLDRAHAVRPELADSPAVRELVRRLDGLPLALELAAARIKLLDPERLVERLAQRLDLLVGTRDADERHATLRATIAWSHELLDAAEQDLFAALAVFRSDFTVETAEDVCDADLATLGSLLDKSLLRRRASEGGDARLFMLETIREYAAERLREHPEQEAALRRRHAERVLRIARAAHLSSEDVGRAVQDPGAAVAARDEIRGALDWALDADPVLTGEIFVALEQHWAMSPPRESRARVERLLADADGLAPALRARLERAYGALLVQSGEVEDGEAQYRSALERFRALGDDANAVALMARFAVHAAAAAEPADARRLVADVLAANESAQLGIVEPQMLGALSTIARREGDFATALEQVQRSVSLSHQSGFRMWELWMLDAQVDLELELGRHGAAAATAERALALALELGDQRLLRSLLASLALTALRDGEPGRAGLLWGVVAEAERSTPLLMGEGFEGVVAPLAGCTDVDFVRAAESSRVLSPEQAAAGVLNDAQTVP